MGLSTAVNTGAGGTMVRRAVISGQRLTERPMGERLTWMAAGGLVLIAAALTFLTAPKAENFWWTDGASFALNGELVRDYLANGLGRNPMGFAMEWYLRYPALSISLYPPIFPLAEAAVFSIAGFSHLSAQITITLFTVLATVGLWRLVWPVSGPALAAASVLLFLAAPEVLIWTRQVAMEIPALSFLVLTAAAFLTHQADPSWRRLTIAAALGLAAVYTKQTAAFVAPGFVVALFVEEGAGMFRRGSNWATGGLLLLGMVPLAVFTVLYASENINIAIGAGTGTPGYERLSVEALLAYGRILPQIAGIVPLVGSAAYLGLVAVKGWSGMAERRLAVLMIAWFLADYLMISVTADFEPRYATYLAVPPAVLTGLLAFRLARVLPVWFGKAVLGASFAVLAITMLLRPVPGLSGYGAVARYILEHAPMNQAVLFHAKESKSFAFSLRAAEAEPRVFVLRSDKLLVDYNIVREWGISDKNLTVGDVEALIDRWGVEYIVLQPDFWTDQPSLAALQTLAYSDRFALEAEFPIETTEAARRTTIRIYRNLHPVIRTGGDVEMRLHPAGLSLSGRL